MKDYNTISGLYSSYVEACYGNLLNEVQEKEIKKSFYAGVISVMSILLKMGSHLSEEAGAAILDGLDQECRQFINDMKNQEKGGDADANQAGERTRPV